MKEHTSTKPTKSVHTPAAAKHIHITGICGVGTSAIAIAFHKNGWKVTGSDKGFYPPVSTYLTENNIAYYAGWHPEKMVETGRPDVVMVGGGGTSLSNPEAVYAKEHHISVLSMAQVIGKYMVRKNSIVTVGTWGKTTTTSLLSFILNKAGLEPSYFIGGLSLSHDTGALTDSEWSVVEGDEYQAAIWDRQAKFNYYAPTHLLLSSVSWDHADLYPTYAEYHNAFKKLVTSLPSNGLLVACSDNEEARNLADHAHCRTVFYGKNPEHKPDYVYTIIAHTEKGLTCKIAHGADTYTIESPMLGRYNAENIAGAFAMACEIGIEPEKVISALRMFKGIKRRLEKRFDGPITVLDCLAPTADKALSVLESIRDVYKKQIIAIFEPNIGGRQRESIDKYNNAFKDADVVLIPHLTKLKVDLSKTQSDDSTATASLASSLTPALPPEGDELAAFIAKTHPNVHYVEDDKALVEKALLLAKEGDVIAFLGSHGFRGMIEETTTSLHQRFQ